MVTTHKYTLFTDTRASTVNANKLSNHLEAVHQSLLKYTSEGDTVVRAREGDEFKAIFTNPSRALNAALAVHQKVIELSDGLSERIGIDDNTFEGDFDVKDYQIEVRAFRIMELCPDEPRDFILCSETFLDALPEHEKETLTLFGPVFVKLNGYDRPVAIYSIGNNFPDDFSKWQIKNTKDKRRGDLHIIELAAQFIAAIPVIIFRNIGLYSIALGTLFILRGISTLFRRKYFECHISIQIADTFMLLRRRNKSIKWANYARELAEKIRGHNELRSLTSYQIGHCLAHDEATEEALYWLKKGYKESSNIRIGAWAALFIGRCYRGMAQKAKTSGQAQIAEDYMRNAENWILTSIVINTSDIGETKGLQKRQLGYILCELVRLRAFQERFADAHWYLNLAKDMYNQAVLQAPGDASWDTFTMKSLRKYLLSYKDKAPTQDYTYRIVEAARFNLSLYYEDHLNTPPALLE